MSSDQWTQVDSYIDDALIGRDAALEAALEASVAAGLPPIQVAPNQGKMLHLLARLMEAGRILEIGTLGGYSTIWLARGLRAGGSLITLEADPKHAEVARSNLAAAGLAERVEVRLGRALQSLPKLEAEQVGPFDMFFIDADKEGNPEYFRWAVRLARPGSLIIVDNVIRNGAVLDASSTDPAVQGVRRLNEVMAAEPRVSATTVQTVGSKGYDGFALAVVSEPARP